MVIVLRHLRGVKYQLTYSSPGCRRGRGWWQWPRQRQTWGCTWLWCELDLRKQLIDNIRAIFKVKLSLQEVGMGVRNAATHNMAGLTTSLLQVQVQTFSCCILWTSHVPGWRDLASRKSCIFMIWLRRKKPLCLSSTLGTRGPSFC